MRPCGLLLLVLAGTSAGCGGGPSFSLTVQHPTGYAVVQTVVTVYFGDNIRCDEIEHGDRTDAELTAITSDEVDVSGGGRIELDRLGGKAVVARGFDIQHRLVTAGCHDVGELAGATSVSITTQPAAVVAIDPGAPDQPFTDRPILITMADRNGAVLDGVVSWQLTGPAGAPDQPPAAGQMTVNGETKIQIDDLGVPGPEGLRLRVPWATAPLPLVTAFDVSHATTRTFAGTITTGVHPSCDVRGHAGKPPTLVCLTAASGLGNHRDAVEIGWTNGAYALTAIPVSDDNAFAIFVDHDGSADEPVYVVGAATAGKNGHWAAIAPAGTDRGVTFDNDLQSLVYVGKCPGGVSAIVGITTGSALVGTLLAPKFQFFTPAGVPIPTMDNAGEVLSGGCVSSVDGQLRQAAVVTKNGDAVLVVLGKDGGRTAVPSGRLTGSGFVTIEAGGASEARFAGTRLQATGTVVFEAVLAPIADGQFQLVERSELDAAAPPTRIVSGKLDHDADSDLIWDMAAGLRKRVFQVALARQVTGVPLTAITSGPENPDNLIFDFAVGDLDGNGIDEIALFSAAGVTIYQQ